MPGEHRRGVAKKKPLVWFASIATAGVVASFALWNPLEIYERAHVCRTTEQSMESLRADIRSDMQSRFLAQIRLAQLWSGRGAFSGRERELSCRLFLEHHAGYLTVEWVAPDNRVLWAVNRDGRADGDTSWLGTAEGLKGLRLAPSAANVGKAVITPRVRLADGTAAVRVIVPVMGESGMAGYVVAVAGVKDLLDDMLEDHKDLGYSVSISEGSTEIYRMAGSTHEYETVLAEQGILELPGAAWMIRVWPKPEILSRWRSAWPEVSMVLGGLLGCVLMLAVHLGGEARRSSRELRRAHDELERRVKDRTIELEDLNATLKREVDERTRAEDSYRDLSGRLLRLQDEERRRIARDLHDSTAQMLGALAINVDRSAALARDGNLGALRTVLAESGQFVEEVTQEIRTVSYLLHPPMLDDLGLQYVLPWYASGFSQRSGISTELHLHPELGRLPGEIELTLFRIVQESLANVHRHSGSPSVSIRLTRDQRVATLEVSDSGTGLPQAVLDRPASAVASLGVGIAGMRERVRQLGGRMEIVSSQEGTTLRTVLPITDPALRAHAA
jgi:signal transduction histidine kinase